MGSASNIVCGPATISFNSVDLGFTKDGIRVRMEREYLDVMADQVKGVVKKGKTLERVYVETTLLEATLANIYIAWDQTTGSFGDPNTNEQELVVVGPAPPSNSLTRTYTMPKAVSIGEGEQNYSREEETSLEVSFECLKNDSGSFGTIAEA